MREGVRKQLASDPGLLEGLAHGSALECLRDVLSALGEEMLLRCAVEDEQDFLGGGVYSNRATADDELGREVEGLPGWHRFGGVRWVRGSQRERLLYFVRPRIYHSRHNDGDYFL